MSNKFSDPELRLILKLVKKATVIAERKPATVKTLTKHHDIETKIVLEQKRRREQS